VVSDFLYNINYKLVFTHYSISFYIEIGENYLSYLILTVYSICFN